MADYNPAPADPIADTHAPSTNGSTTVQNVKDTVVSSMLPKLQQIPSRTTLWQMVRISTNLCPHPMTSIDMTGPVAENVKDQANKTSTEFQNLANSKKVPDQPAATGQPLTHYHSMFYNLLSWENPRATSIAFASSILLIFVARYFNVIKYAFKMAYFVCGITATLEIAGKLFLDNGLTSKFRPRKYWTIPREALEASLDDVEQLVNFFVIESQRIIFAENVYATIAVFVAALVSYWLIKIVPLWGLCLIGTCVIYLTPLVYVKNRETIDGQLEHVNNLVSTQASQIKDLTAQHTGKATESLKASVSGYTAKAQEYMGSRKSPAVTSNDLPTAPKTEPIGATPESTAAPPEPVAAH